MQLNINQMVRRMRDVLCVLTALIFVMGATRPASAQWSAANAEAAYSGYKNAFLHTNSDGSQYFEQKEGNTTAEGFWTQAEEIEVAEDAYYQNPTTNNKNTVANLINGFRGLHGDANNWGSTDNYNDDLNVATIAFARCYQIVGAGICLSDAETSFSTVWGRAQAGDGGLCQNVKLGCYENSSANWTFVIAGNLLYNITGTTSYQTEKDGVYTWAKANLYDSTTGGVRDGKGGGISTYTYNYGYAMIAGSYQGSNIAVPKMADYVFNSFPSSVYDGTSGGYNIMPDYSNGGTIHDGNDNGFNGILMRGVGFANSYGYLPSADLLAAQANINAAWSFRNPYALSWDDWDLTTTGDSYSWNDSSTLAGMLDLPPTA